VSVYSAVLNGQLVPTAPSIGVTPAPAAAPSISVGSSPSTLPGGRAGGALSSVGTAAPQQGGSAGSTAGPQPTIAGLGVNLMSLPWWQNPIVLTVGLFLLGYFGLRVFHWRA
jgi:hypothetical protein